MAQAKRARPLKAHTTHVAKRAPAPVATGDRRKQDRARAALMASSEKQADLAKMLEREQANGRRLILKGVVEAGLTQAEVARIMGLTDGRVWQIIREEKGAAEAAELRRQLREAKGGE